MRINSLNLYSQNNILVRRNDIKKLNNGNQNQQEFTFQGTKGKILGGSIVLGTATAAMGGLLATVATIAAAPAVIAITSAAILAGETYVGSKVGDEVEDYLKKHK